MAQRGIVWWADVTNPTTGDWMTWSEMRAAYRLSESDHHDYTLMLNLLNRPVNLAATLTWRTHVTQSAQQNQHISQPTAHIHSQRIQGTKKL